MHIDYNDYDYDYDDDDDSVQTEVSCCTEEEYSEIKLERMVVQQKLMGHIAEQTLTNEHSAGSSFRMQEVFFHLWYL
jgi:hypothetical protein